MIACTHSLQELWHNGASYYLELCSWRLNCVLTVVCCDKVFGQLAISFRVVLLRYIFSNCSFSRVKCLLLRPGCLPINSKSLSKHNSCTLLRSSAPSHRLTQCASTLIWVFFHVCYHIDRHPFQIWGCFDYISASKPFSEMFLQSFIKFDVFSAVSCLSKRFLGVLFKYCIYDAKQSYDLTPDRCAAWYNLKNISILACSVAFIKMLRRQASHFERRVDYWGLPWINVAISSTMQR